MKIYLGFTVAGSRSSIEAAKKILSVLESFGHDALTSHFVSDDAWEADQSVAPQKIFARDMTWLAQCDLFVAEVTGSSFGLGFETGYLLGATDKKTILFLSGAQHTGFLSSSPGTRTQTTYWRRTPISGNWRS
jgi:nucleoside 2-deoxyribosyltransferase